MQSADNIIDFVDFKRDSQQELIDDIGARAFLFLRDAAEQQDIPIKDVLVEHMLGLMMVMGAVEGKEEAQRILGQISAKIA
jgi:hypothetical protein